jgi:DNA helicase-2/ATP-dependent DNA helicase PcrA
MGPLTEAQRNSVFHPASRLQILACAGSGKTEVLARRAVELLLKGIDPASVVAFTFTEKAAGELKRRIETRAAEGDRRFEELPPVGRGMFIGTTHSWALQALQDLGGKYGTMEGLTEEQEWALLLRIARRLGIVDLYASLEGKTTDRVAVAPAIEIFLRSVEVVHNERIDRQALREVAPAFAQVLERYEWLLEEMRLLPFRLMIGRAVDELAPGGRLRHRLAGRIAHVLVDEFQDFNLAQDHLLARLAELATTITVVADDDQAIYQWRGGNVHLFVSFARRYQGTQVVRLGENHRCRPEIVAFARHVVDGLPGRLDKVLESARGASPSGAVEVAIAETAEDEARALAGRIARLIMDGHQPRDIAVLYRSVRTSARPLIEQLRARDIPVMVVGKTSLFARPEMALIARILVFWAGGTWYPNPQFEPEVVSAESLRDEIRRVTLASDERVDQIFRALAGLGEQVRREGVSDSVVLFNEILALLGLPVAGTDAKWQELGLGQMSELLTSFDHSIRRAAPRALYEGQTGDRADEAEEDTVLSAEPPSGPPPSALGATRGEVYLMRLKAFLEEFAGRAAEETPDRMPEIANAVQIMTVHQAKGLEFPVVFVPSLIEGRFPSALMGRTQHWYVPPAFFDQMRYEGREEDEARVLYVALTRARELLVVSWFKSHLGRRAQPSRFLTRHLRPALRDSLSLGGAQPPVASTRGRDEELLDIDFSSLITYVECGYKYWLRYVCGFQPPLAPEIGFGKILHHLVAELARRAIETGLPPSREEVGSLVDEAFYLPFAGSVPAQKLREAILRRVSAYLAGYGEELARAIRPEARFEVPLASARVRGRIDLVLRAGGPDPGEVELIDFKTSANRPPSEIHINQLRMYAAAAGRQGLKPVRLAIHDLDADEGGRLEVPHDDAARGVFQKRLERWVEGIRSGAFEPVDDRRVCRSCDFRRFCRYAPQEVRRT